MLKHATEIDQWNQARKRPTHIAGRVRMLFEDGYTFGNIVHELRRYITMEALRVAESKVDAAQIMGVHPNTITRNCQEFGLTDEVIKQIKEID